MQGKVKWFNEAKGFGFIVTPEGKDYFVHYSTIKGKTGFKTLKEGDKVEFMSRNGAKGLEAYDVGILS